MHTREQASYSVGLALRDHHLGRISTTDLIKLTMAIEQEYGLAPMMPFKDGIAKAVARR